eukprot:6221951-Amphidinium_carterae.1
MDPDPDQVMEDGSDEGEQPEELRRLIIAREPSTIERKRHEQENHAVYKDWCPICVAAKGTGAQHRRKAHNADTEREGPRIFSDFFYMSSHEGSKPMLALKFSRSGRVAAT